MSAVTAGVLEPCQGVLVVGDQVRWDGNLYRVAMLRGSMVHLEPEPGTPGVARLADVSLLAAAGRFELAAERTMVVPDLPPTDLLAGLAEHAEADARDWEAHIIECHTGLMPGRTVPRAGYDPAATTLVQRYQAKSAELAEQGAEVSWQTIQRKRLRWVEQGLWGLVDKRHTRCATAFGRVDARVVDALRAIRRKEAEDRESPGNGKRLQERLERYVSDHTKDWGGDVPRLPSKTTFYNLLVKLGIRPRRHAHLERGGGRKPSTAYTPTLASRPGEAVQMDTTDLDVMVIGSFGQPVPVELVLAVDVATRSICAAVLREKLTSEKEPRRSRAKGRRSRRGKGKRQTKRRVLRRGRAHKGIDCALLLGRMLVPEPMRPTWPQRAAMTSSRLPHQRLIEIDARLGQATARPVITPKHVYIDQGGPYISQTFLDACASMRIVVHPCRYVTPTDKSVVERTNLSVKTLLAQHLKGYTGGDPAHRGRGAAAGPLFTLYEANEILQQWIVFGWQEREHDELRDPQVRGRALTPNEKYTACVATAGYLPVPMDADRYLSLIDTTFAPVTDQGIEIDHRRYDSDELGEYRRTPSGLKRTPKWMIRHDPYDLSRVWLCDTRGPERRWVPALFTDLSLIGGPFTQDMWEAARQQHLSAGGRKEDQDAIARLTADLLARASAGPKALRPELVAAPPPLLTARPPLAGDQLDLTGLPPLDPATVQPFGEFDPDEDENAYTIGHPHFQAVARRPAQPRPSKPAAAPLTVQEAARIKALGNAEDDD